MGYRLVGIGLVVALATASLNGCGADAGSANDREPGRADPASGSPPSPGTDAPATPDTALEGVWQVVGNDARGTYRGEVEIATEGGALRFTRVVRYDGVKVEDGRDLWWVWEGTAKGTRAKLTVEVDLVRADWIKRRGSLERTIADGPVRVTGTFTSNAPGAPLVGTFTGPSVAEQETWSSRRDRGAASIFTLDRKRFDAHAPPSASKKTTMFAAFAEYHKLPTISPYVKRPEFEAAIHGIVVDRTDLGFYRANPKALRVVNKVIDEISLAETLMRARAFAPTLEQKAALFQADFDNRFMDPAVGMVVDGGPTTGPFGPSYDSALWTATYMAAQAYQYEVTGDAKALARLKTSLDALLKLQEITGDWKQFARTLRKPTGNLSDGWVAGTGPYANLEWRSGGNNDMMKGLLYGYLVGWKVLCKTATLDAGLCDRIRANAVHLADDVQIERPNHLATAWLAAIVRGGDLKYQVKATGLWAGFKIEIQNNPPFYDNGISDWSGNHLRFTERTIEAMLAEEWNIGGEAAQIIKTSIDDSYQKLKDQRLAVWHMIQAAYGSGAKSSPAVDDFRLRLAEIPYPKVTFDIDRRISPTFCVSPYPNLPWKGDFLDLTVADRSHSLVHYPTYEMPIDVNYFKQHATYVGAGDYEAPAPEYLHVYWYARKHGLLKAGE